MALRISTQDWAEISGCLLITSSSWERRLHSTVDLWSKCRVRRGLGIMEKFSLPTDPSDLGATKNREGSHGMFGLAGEISIIMQILVTS
jgi:hypothetical protein